MTTTVMCCCALCCPPRPNCTIIKLHYIFAQLHCTLNSQIEHIILQGTTTNGRYLLPFKTGAFVAGKPVQPVLLHYPQRRGALSISISMFLRWIEPPAEHRMRAYNIDAV